MAKPSNTLKYLFDREADVLYVTTRRPSVMDNSQELANGVVVRRDPKTKKITGFTVLNFLARQQSRSSEIALPLSATFETQQRKGAFI